MKKYLGGIKNEKNNNEVQCCYCRSCFDDNNHECKYNVYMLDTST